MERSDVVGKIRIYRAELTAEMNRIDAELRRLDAALAAFDVEHENVSSAPFRSAATDSAAGTFDLLREYVRANSTIDAITALEYLVERGWRTDARHPLNATRTALAHLATWGEIERVRRGLYRPAGSDDPVGQQATEVSANSRTAGRELCCGPQQAMA
jgi:hypothetical protein